MAIIYDESNTTYHSNPAISHSKLETFRLSPELFKRKYIDMVLINDPTPAMRLGTAAHTMTLEGQDAFDRAYCIDLVGARKGSKAHEDLLREAGGREIISFENAALVRDLANTVWANSHAKELMQDGDSEITFRANLHYVDVQCRADFWSKRRNILVDLKTCASIETFEKDFFRRGYHRQAGLYTSLIKECCDIEWPQMKWDYPKIYYIAIETSEAMRCRVYAPDEDSVKIGAAESIADIVEVYTCKNGKGFKCKESEIKNIFLPPWYKGESA